MPQLMQNLQATNSLWKEFRGSKNVMASYHVKYVSVPKAPSYISVHCYSLVPQYILSLLFLSKTETFVFTAAAPDQEPIYWIIFAHSHPHCTSICNYWFGINHYYFCIIHTGNLVLVVPPSLDISRKRWKAKSNFAHFPIRDKIKRMTIS